MKEQDKSHFWRFAAGLAALMALGLGIYYGIGWYEWRNARNEATANDRALQEMKEWEAKYENDTYGGKTPEETLALFVDALKKGDIELASKYFVVDEQEKVKADLKKTMLSTGLDRMIQEAEKLQLTKKTEDEAFYALVNADKFVEVEIVLGKVLSGVWKIFEL